MRDMWQCGCLGSKCIWSRQNQRAWIPDTVDAKSSDCQSVGYIWDAGVAWFFVTCWWHWISEIKISENLTKAVICHAVLSLLPQLTVCSCIKWFTDDIFFRNIIRMQSFSLLELQYVFIHIMVLFGDFMISHFWWLYYVPNSIFNYML